MNTETVILILVLVGQVINAIVSFLTKRQATHAANSAALAAHIAKVDSNIKRYPAPKGPLD